VFGNLNITGRPFVAAFFFSIILFGRKTPPSSPLVFFAALPLF
jgi:hypothetical protein